jgi:glucose 1-dehydrogenase
MKGLGGKTALITGATSGIGRAIAIRLFQEGCNVAIDYLDDKGAAEETARLAHAAAFQSDQIGFTPRTTEVQADVTREDDVQRMIRTTAKEFGKLDILINNAGIHFSKPSQELSLSDFDAVLDVNLRGAFMCAREAIASFLSMRTPGVIINLSSVHQIIPKPNYLGYSASRGATGNLTRTLALEFAQHGIRVNAIAPGATATPINRPWVENPVKYQEVVRHIPLNRVGTAEEMAAATAFLCSDEASYITGQTLFIDGGLTIYADFRTAWSSE